MSALGMALFASNTVAQQKSLKEQLLGAWSLVSIEFVRPDGSRSSTLGANPHGVAFFDAGGHYIISVMRSDRAKYDFLGCTLREALDKKQRRKGASPTLALTR